MFNREIFRKKALDKLSSPDDLDELLQVNSKSSWVLVVSLLCLIMGGLFWGIYGQIVNKVAMTGVILPVDPPVSLITEVSGQADSVFHFTGDQLLADQPICKIIPFNGKAAFYIKSPCDGELLEMNAGTGNFLEAGAIVAKIGNTRRKRITRPEFLFFVPENKIDNLAIGQKVNIDIGGESLGYTKISSWITYIGRLPASVASIGIIPDEDEAARLKNGSYYLIRTVYIPLLKEKDPFPGFSVKDWFGNVYHGEAITSQKSPISYLLSPLKTK